MGQDASTNRALNRAVLRKTLSDSEITRHPPPTYVPVRGHPPTIRKALARPGRLTPVRPIIRPPAARDGRAIPRPVRSPSAQRVNDKVRGRMYSGFVGR